jgi:hypothetical protein
MWQIMKMLHVDFSERVVCYYSRIFGWQRESQPGGYHCREVSIY